MKEFKGTPGPWSWNGEDYRGDWGWQILVGPSGEGLVIGESSDGRPFKGLKAHQDIDAALCRTGFHSTPGGAPSVHVRYHNAQLIAAAPDLLKELQRLRDYVINVCGVDDEDCDSEHPLMSSQAAISKALGEE